MTTVQF
jgi:hypothetical protein